MAKSSLAINSRGIVADPVTGRGDARGWGYDYGREELYDKISNRVNDHQTRDELEALEQKKDTNPKDAVGIKKPGMSSVPTGPLMYLGLAMMEGARKYGRHNYRAAGVRPSVYYDACLRHLMAYYDFSQDTDPGSGLPHLAKAMACLCVLLDGHMMGNINDDRPPPLPIEFLDEMQTRTNELFERYPLCVEAYTRDNVKPKE